MLKERGDSELLGCDVLQADPDVWRPIWRPGQHDDHTELRLKTERFREAGVTCSLLCLPFRLRL